ncbi:hypothetical protein NLX83_15620 [Allokutzneria sp. A3M-2-11 16]|uniref:hypothetical protein n=1 Tax=Allokutzneria sp. A3M-2-11 16 TaxID=2962043 RepID=UPI0020B6A81A|nr:hypothetical protein [Allokutzneria sp. A3M-2-11 16]MCP3800696.1 hypothetical protein [Allokutzneria sp. A3M-2-11 16]
MLTAARVSIVGGVTVAAMVAGLLPAFADIYGSVECTQSPTPDCQLGAGTTGRGGGTGPRRGGPQQPKPVQPRREASGKGDSVSGNLALSRCSYVRSSYQPPSGGGATTISFTSSAAQDSVAVVRRAVLTRHDVAVPQFGSGPRGAWYVWRCSGDGFADAFYRPPVWIPEGAQPDAVRRPSPAEVAAQAREQLRLPTPTLGASPAGEHLVHLPSWLWLSSGWASVSATAEVPGVSVTAVARPRSVSWSMGDGTTITCTGGGTPFRPGSDPRSASPDCGHTYRTSSAAQPNKVFTVSATVRWTVTWSGAGQAGTFPDLTTTASTSFRVAESQALNTDSG